MKKKDAIEGTQADETAQETQYLAVFLKGEPTEEEAQKAHAALIEKLGGEKKLLSATSDVLVPFHLACLLTPLDESAGEVRGGAINDNFRFGEMLLAFGYELGTQLNKNRAIIPIIANMRSDTAIRPSVWTSREQKQELIKACHEAIDVGMKLRNQAK